MEFIENLENIEKINKTVQILTTQTQTFHLISHTIFYDYRFR